MSEGTCLGVTQGRRAVLLPHGQDDGSERARVKRSISPYTSEYVMCWAGLCSPEGHGSACTADSFSVRSKPTPEHLAPHFLCQKGESGFHLFEIHYSQRSPT